MKYILCYGDSNTFGFDGRKMADGFFRARYDRSTRWTGLLSRMLGEEYEVIEEGMGGRTTIFDDPLVPGRNGLTFLNVAVESHEPLDLVIIMLGTNDTRDIFPTTEQICAEAMTCLIRRLKEILAASMNPSCRILIVSPVRTKRNKYGSFCYDYSEKALELGPKLASLYQKVAEQQECFFADADKWCSVDENDGVHLNADGHRSIAENLAKLIPTLF